MSQAPSMPIFTDALLGDTLHLSAEEFGAYCLILFATWRNNGQALADDDVELARICRVSTRKWRSLLRSKCAGFFDISDGFWHQKRLEKEWTHVQQAIAKARKNGRNGGRPKLRKIAETGNPDHNLDITQTITTHTQPQQEEESPPPSLSPPSRARAAPGGAPDGAHDGDGVLSEKRFAFEGTIVRVKPRDFAKWKASYHAIPDLTAELQAIDDKLVDEGYGGKWFSRVGGWLRAIHTTYLDQKTSGGSRGYPQAASEHSMTGSPDWRHRMRIWFDEQHGGPTRGNWPQERWGPPPGEPGCEVPPEVLAEFRKEA